ncbi:glutathione-independent glyoxalase Hsp31p [Diutina catenulata]
MHKKVAIAVTSYHQPFYSDGANTGAFVVELQHPFYVFHDNGFQVDFVSETGKFGWDDHSKEAPFLTGKDKTDYEDSNSAFNQHLVKIKTPSECNPEDYDIFFASAGHGTLFDYPTAKGLQQLAASIYAQGGIISAVCHGPAIFSGLVNSTTGKPMIEGKAITGFTDLGEKLLKVETIMKAKNLMSVEDIAKKEGAIYLPPISPWDDYSVTDDRIVTGVNPASAASTAKRCIIALKHHQKKIPHRSVDDFSKLGLSENTAQSTTAAKVPGPTSVPKAPGPTAAPR